MSLKLYAFPPSPRSFKVLWAANHVGVDYEFRFVDFRNNEHKMPEFAKLNPNGKAPVLEHDGFVLWESNAIIEYLASLKSQSGLMPADPPGQNAVRKWLFWDCAHWDPACAVFAVERVVKPLFGLGEPNEAEVARGTQMFDRVATVLDGELKKHRYVAGDALTLADFALGNVMHVAEQARFPMENFRNIQRWAEDLMALPSWKKTTAMGERARSAA